MGTEEMSVNKWENKVTYITYLFEKVTSVMSYFSSYLKKVIWLHNSRYL